LLSQAFPWESLLRWDYNLLLSRVFQWESLLRWDLSYNLLLSRAFWWESLLRWDLGFHRAFGYQGASFSKHFFLFFSLVYHGALSRIFLSHGGIQAKTEPFFTNFSFSQWNSGYNGAFFHELFLSLNGTQAITEPFSRTFLSLNGPQAITEPFSRTFLSLNRTQAITEPCHGIILSLWDFGYHGAFSWNHSFTLGFRLSRSLLMESFFHFGISAITEPSHGIILSL
jgi:hypothetical protein